MDIQWPLAIFSLLAGCGGVVLATTGLSELMGIAEKTRQKAVIWALALLIVGGCASVFHLAQKANIMAAAANVFSFSGISMELIFLGLNVIVGIVYLVVAKRSGFGGATKAIGIVGIVTGMIMAFVVGNGYVMEAQPYWNTLTLPLAYLGSGLACGTALFCALMAASGEEDDQVKRMGVVAVTCIVIELITFLAYGGTTGFILDAAWYWFAAVVVGGVAAGVLAVMGLKNKSLFYGSAVCALVGGLGLRAAMFLAGVGFIDAFAIAAQHIALGI